MLADLLSPLAMDPTAVHSMVGGVKWMDPEWLLQTFGNALFWISMAIIFVECGVLFPFLPGDTLLFALGLFIVRGDVDLLPGPNWVELVFVITLLFFAAIGGNLAGYEIGHRVGPRLRHRDGRILKARYFDQTEVFLAKHGNKALVIGRFVPFVRTFITVVCGIAQMDRRRFLYWSAVGAVLWVAGFVVLGYGLGTKYPKIAERLDLAIIAIFVVTALPVVFEILRHRLKQRRQSA